MWMPVTEKANFKLARSRNDGGADVGRASKNPEQRSLAIRHVDEIPSCFERECFELKRNILRSSWFDPPAAVHIAVVAWRAPV